jgi:DnaJ domain
MPYAAQKEPADTGVAVYFLRRKKQMVFACDRWHTVQDNMRAIQKTIDAIRGIERWGASEMMERAFQAFEALPAPSTCWTILGIKPGASEADINAAYRARARGAHPDTGGSEAKMSELNRARDEALSAH